MSLSFKDIYRLSLQLPADEQKRLAEFLLNPPAPLESRQILDHLSAHAGQLRQLGVEKIGVFGSYARGDTDTASDIDILVKLTHTSFRDFMRLKFYLEDLLSRPVDLVLEEGLREELRPSVLSEVIYAEGF